MAREHGGLTGTLGGAERTLELGSCHICADDNSRSLFLFPLQGERVAPSRQVSLKGKGACVPSKILESQKS